MNLAGGMVVAVVLVALTILPAHAASGPTQNELDAAAANATDWLHTNHDYGGQRFVDATGINRQNANALQPGCRYVVGDPYPFYTNPLVYRGVMYLTTASDTIAIDATTCALRWRHHWAYKARANWPQSRGVALKAGTIVRGMRDGYLLALDADTGSLLWERAAGDPDKGETFTMPPVIFEDLVIIGPAGGEVPIKGWVGAFKLKDGASTPSRGLANLAPKAGARRTHRRVAAQSGHRSRSIPPRDWCSSRREIPRRTSSRTPDKAPISIRALSSFWTRVRGSSCGITRRRRTTPTIGISRR
jgi:glucose dehydrogenase